MTLSDAQKAEITAARADLATTARPTVPALEAMLYEPMPVLDHGFVRVIDYMGDDAAIVQAARVSYGRGTRRVSGDAGLIRYLMRHRHCYHPEMQVLTADGWKHWKDCAESEIFMVPDPSTRTYRMERLSVVKFHADEDMMTFKNERMSYCVTRDHKMWFRGKYQFTFSNVSAGEMSRWGWFDPLVGYQHPGKIEGGGDDRFRFIGFFLGDGRGDSANRISFHLKKTRKLEYLEGLLDRLELSFSVRPSSSTPDAFHYSVSTPEFLRRFVDPMTRSAGKCTRTSVAELTPNEVSGLVDGILSSDGYVRSDRPSVGFSSTSLSLCDLLCALAPRIGLDAHFDKSCDTYRVSVHQACRTSLESRASYHGTSHHTGNVFCATSSTGLLAVRGSPQSYGFVCGNSTPFEMCEIKYHVKLPIFVARQFIRHRTASVNEYSARYSILDREFYIPSPEKLAAQSVDNRQGRGDVLQGEEASWVLDLLRTDAGRCYDHYAEMLNEVDDEAGAPPHESHQGLARELARMNLTLNTYTQWYWKTDLHNLFHFLSLRADPHAQYEIRVYAEAMLRTVQAWVPMACEAFRDYRLGAVTLSAQALTVVQQMLAGLHVHQPNSGMGRREWDELMAALERPIGHD